jgi:hypothetical protein
MNGVGAVIHNWGGRVLTIRCMNKQGCLHPSTAEAWARAQATKFGKEMGLSPLYLEVDAKFVVEVVNLNDTN